MGFSIAIFPFSWALGGWTRPKKYLFAIGPFRFIAHWNVGPWVGDPCWQNSGKDGDGGECYQH
jgi:hypothetical protein